MRPPLRLCFLADLNSIHARKWVGYFAERGHEIRVISSHYFDPSKMDSVEVVNLVERTRRPLRDALGNVGLLDLSKAVRTAFNRALPDKMASARADRAAAHADVSEVAGYISLVRNHRQEVARLVHEFAPDVFQSLRLYPEGMLAADVSYTPWALMAWGQCISLWADHFPPLDEFARQAVQHCSYYMADNMRDIHDARRYGLPSNVPWHITPSGGGVETEKLRRLKPASHAAGDATFMTFRRIGGSFIDNRPVIRALPILRQRYGIKARFVIYGHSSGHYYEQVRLEAKRLGVSDQIEIRPPFPYHQLAQIVSNYDLVVSSATFDGTTNALLETMWLGGIPINGDLPPIREWIEHGVNGYVFNLQDPADIADVFKRALDERDRHDEFRERNRRIIMERADYKKCMSDLENIYYSIADKRTQRVGGTTG